MLKNLSDYASIVTLILMTVLSFRFFLVSVMNREKDDNSRSRMQLIREYLDNTEE
ncbi:MAG: hypothetical protein II529_06630 [Erysipelotrichaceae bacterium]|nr:hypothetical protein [Erysipelotrichaceae bacterium]